MLPAWSTAFHCTKRAGGTLSSESLAESCPELTRVHGLQLRSGLFTLPLRAYSSMLPALRMEERPHKEKIWASKTSPSYVPSASGAAPRTKSFPKLLLDA